MMKLHNPFSAKAPHKNLPDEELAFTRFPATVKPNYSRQRTVKPSERTVPTAIPRAQPKAHRQAELNADVYEQTRIPVAVLRKALPLRFERMEAAGEDEFVFQ